jgi:hypothetical protein
MSYYCWKLGWCSFVMYFQYFLHTKNPILTLRKWKLIFLCIENEKSQYKLCLPSQYAHICTIWGHLNKLFHDLGHDLAHLAWKPCNFVHYRSYLRRGFYNICNSPSSLFFLITRSHNMTQCEGFTFFYFFEFLRLDSKCGRNGKHEPS